MKIAVIGAFGKTGRAVIKETQSRGHEVLAIAHKNHEEIDLSVEQLLIKDIMDLTTNDLKGVDAVVDAISAWTPETFYVHTDGISHLANILKGTNIRYLKVGGAGTLFINSEHTKMLKDRSNYPKDWLPLADVLVESLRRLRSYSDIRWTYVTPAFNYDPEGIRTGKYQVDGEEYRAKDDSKNYISYADYAVGMLDIIEHESYIRQRITLVGNK
ncbi:NAD(P)-dependent oxidoreductase [Companilactobacillus huachuanensis]|uniref:NAD(P)-dependent oxidoreductase n=1 Tax=Companilactobacillus huachuanensis TaxID=2559914 RepID=A0ABW1RKL6_9LACO|nr:NAD(P)H-binding protein [Companilactobacillus huachuanensis]